MTNIVVCADGAWNSPLHRPLLIKEKPTLIHPSVKIRYESDDKYRPPNLKTLLESTDGGWEGIDVGS